MPELADWLESIEVSQLVLDATFVETRLASSPGREQERLRKKGSNVKKSTLHHYDRQAYRQIRCALAIVAALPTKKQRRKFAKKIVSDELLSQLVHGAGNRKLTAFWQMSDAKVWGEVETAWLTDLIAEGQRGAELKREFDDRLLQEKLASLRQLAYGASHEINNPLANISMRAQALQRNEDNPSRLKSLRTIYEQAMRAHHMITDMMLFANPPAVNRQPADIVNLLSDVISTTAVRFPDRDFKMTLERPDRSIQSNVDATQIAELVAALLQNAIDAFIDSGEVHVAIDWNKDAELVIRVRDNGPGIDPETARHMFDPFFSGREAGRGLGFGLSKAWTIANQHGGSLHCISAEKGNTLFEATIPTEECGESDSNHGHQQKRPGQSAA